MSRSGVKLPNLLKPTALDRPVNQRLETTILFPATANQSSCKFVFDRKGILDSNSQVEIMLLVPEFLANGAVAPNVSESKSCLPATTGIAAVVKSAYLEIGGRRVATLNEVGQYINWRRSRWSPEYREQIATIKQGGNDVFVGSGSPAYPVVAPFGTIGRPSNETIQLTAANASTTSAHQILHSKSASSPGFVLSLSQLCPMLRGVQLPLFAIAQEVSLVIEFKKNLTAQTAWCPPLTHTANSAGVQGTIHIPSLKIMADYLFYPDEMDNLSSAIMSQGGYDILYDEVQTQTSFEGSSTGTTFDFTAQLALGGKKVKSLVVKRLSPASGADNFGIYKADALTTPSTYNWVIDSKPFYAQSVSNSATLFNETSRVDDSPLRISQAQYSWKNSAGVVADSNFTARTFNGHSQIRLQGRMKPVGLRLTNSAITPVAFSPVTSGEAALPYNHMFFITCQRLLNISNGLVNMIE